MNWTDERVELLRKLWGEGLSASQIAAQIGGVSRNAVIGKVHRLKLSGRGKQTAAQPRVKKPVQATQAARPVSSGRTTSSGGSSRISSHSHAVGATALKADYEVRAIAATVLEFTPSLTPPESKQLKLVELSERTCKWPIGDPLAADFNFCGNDSGDAGPYCQFHAKMAYQPASDRRRAR
jgi:GcrA cell cycle regulator